MNVIPLSAGNSGQKLKFYINRNKRLKKCLEQENEPPKKAVILQTLALTCDLKSKYEDSK